MALLERIRFAFTLVPLLSVIMLLTPKTPLYAQNSVAGDLRILSSTRTAPNGAWSWFEDERAIIDDSDPQNRLLMVSSVSAGPGAESGDVDLLWLNIDTGERGEFELHDQLEQDDHDSAALWRRPDGRYLAVYGKHHRDQLMRYRVSTNVGDPTDWQPEQTVDASPGSNANTTYSNLHYLSNDRGGQGRLYNFVRSNNFDPNLMVSEDYGDTWIDSGRLLSAGTGGTRPYMRYFSDGDAIHFFATDAHPRDFNNSIYHGYVRDGALYKSDGTLLDGNLLDASAAAPTDLTTVFAANTTVRGVPMTRAWNVDLAIDAQGDPYGIFQTRIDPGPLSAGTDSLDHQFFFSRYDSSQGDWVSHPLALAGRDIYASSPNATEDDYTGLAAVDPNDPKTLYISTPIDPRTNMEMDHYEIFRGNTSDGGATWQWDPITFDSNVDNIRPIVPEWNETETALVWMRGNYTSYINWDTEVAVLTEFGPLSEQLLADLDSDGVVDISDYAIFVRNLNTDLNGINDSEEARLLGDLNGDWLSDFTDLTVFRREYDLHNGFGALSRDLESAVPEPTSIATIATILLVTQAWSPSRRTQGV